MAITIECYEGKHKSCGSQYKKKIMFCTCECHQKETVTPKKKVKKYNKNKSEIYYKDKLKEENK
jgi:hypothetical protein